MSGRRYTIFVEVADGSNPPWDVYRHVCGENLELAKAKALRMVQHDLDCSNLDLRVSRVFPGHIQEITE